jgi:hypothetical protein
MGPVLHVRPPQAEDVGESSELPYFFPRPNLKSERLKRPLNANDHAASARSDRCDQNKD